MYIYIYIYVYMYTYIKYLQLDLYAGYWSSLFLPRNTSDTTRPEDTVARSRSTWRKRPWIWGSLAANSDLGDFTCWYP